MDPRTTATEALATRKVSNLLSYLYLHQHPAPFVADCPLYVALQVPVYVFDCAEHTPPQSKTKVVPLTHSETVPLPLQVVVVVEHGGKQALTSAGADEVEEDKSAQLALRRKL